MEVVGLSTSRRTGQLDDRAAVSLGAYLNLYLEYSLGDQTEFSLEDLEAFALARLQVLKTADQVRGAPKEGTQPAVVEGVKSALKVAAKKHEMSPSGSGPSRKVQTARDEASHFVLRLALCKTPETRSWLLARECELLQMRMDGLGSEAALQTLGGIPEEQRPRLERAHLTPEIRLELDAVARGVRRGKELGARHYRVPWEDVPNLVGKRMVSIKEGWAYVPESYVTDVVLSQFRSRLSRALAMSAKAIINVESDPRMAHLLATVRGHWAAFGAKADFSLGESDAISINEVDASISSMPLCMQNQMNTLKTKHHLRHKSRLQFGAFLKGCGLTADESLTYFAREFAKKPIDAQKFEKQYSYWVRHMYGLVGGKKQFHPFSCGKIINERPGTDDQTGCPFREMEVERLKVMLRKSGVAKPEEIGIIVDKAKEGQWQVACGMTFTVAHIPNGLAAVEAGHASAFMPTHPNEYFINARRRKLGTFTETPTAMDIPEDVARDIGDPTTPTEQVSAEPETRGLPAEPDTQVMPSEPAPTGPMDTTP